MATIKLRQVNPVVFDNNVGLGDMNPNEKLVLNNGNIRLQSYNAGQGLIFKSTSSLGNWASIKFIQPDSTPTWQIIVDEAGNKTNDFKIVSGAATKVFHMDSIGTIGMGVNVPRSHLHIGGARGGSIALTNSTIGDGPSDGSDIYASTDEHLHIQNRQAIGGIIFRTNGNEGLFINSSQNVSVGVADLDSSEFSHLTPHSRFLIHKSGIGDNVTQGMLHLWGKFSVSTLGNGEEFLSHRVTFENSTGSIKNSFSPIQFSHNDSKIDTYLNKDNGSVKIGPGVAATENGLLEVANNGLNVVTRVRLYSNSADAYLSFGDDRQNWIVGADYSSESFVIGHVGNGTLTPSSGGALYISANNEVGIGTGSAGPSYTLEVNSGTTNEIARFASTDDDGLISVGDHNDMTYIGYDHSNTAMSLGFDNGMGATNLIIKPDGNVGIGTGSNTIGSRLHVKDSITEVARFENTTASNPVWIQLKNADGFAQIGSRAGTIELAPSGSVMATFQADGKIKVGATKQTPIRHLQDNVEANTLVPICVTEDHGNDKVIYTGSLSAIEEDDIIVCSVNFGLSDVSTDVYNPHINFALVLGKTEYSDFGDPADDYSTIIGKHTVRLTDTRTLVYGGDLTGGKTAYAKNSGYGGVASGPIANDDTTTSWKSGTGGVNWWWIDFGSGEIISQLKLKPCKSCPRGPWGGVKNFTIYATNDAPGSGGTSGTWTELFSATHPSNEDWATYQWTNSQSFRYYKIYMSDGWVSGGWPAIDELEMMSSSAGSGAIFPLEQHLGGMYKLTADDVTKGRETVNFIVWAEHTNAQANCADNLTISDSGSLDILHIKGNLSD